MPTAQVKAELPRISCSPVVQRKQLQADARNQQSMR